MRQNNKKGRPGFPVRPARFDGGDEGVRTLGLRLAKPALSQLSYIPIGKNKRPSGDSAHAEAFITK